VPNCENVLDQNSDVVSFHDREGHLEDVVSKAIAKTGMKPLSIAYRDFPTADFEDLKASNGNFETEESRKVIEEDLTLVATFGFVDALRPGVQ
jgi:magnesium-transporting ATPase (P-type)